MKKFLCVLSAVLCGVMLVGCGGEKKSTDTIHAHIIEKRNNIFVATDEVYYASFVTGEREEPYGLDGVIGESTPFGIVTISKLDNTRLNSNEYVFTLTINGEAKGGTLEKSPYDFTYSADIGMSVDDDAEIVLQVNIDGKTFEQTLFNESKNFQVTQEKAIEIAGKELKDSINSMKDVDGKTCEAIVKILKDYSGENGRYFWYVGVISADGKTAGILIDANTGDIVSKKV